MDMGDKKGRVFVLGLDGATLDVMMPMIERGELPAFKKIMTSGGCGRLRSVAPPLSPPAWVSFATGKNPGKNGIIGFTRMVPNTYKLALVSGQDNQSRTVWELLSDAGKKVIVLNVPMTYPPRPVNGLMISGLDTPDVHSDFTYPPSLKEEIFSRFPDYRINLQLGGYLQSDRRRRTALRMILDNIDSRYRVTEYLMDQYPWDFFIVKFNNPDIVQHHFWKYMDPDHPEYDPGCADDLRQAIFSVYRRLDEVASLVMEKLDEDTTFLVMSDHGAGARINKVVYLNEWLRERGYLKALDGRQRSHGRLKSGLPGRIFSCGNKLLSFLFRNTSPKARIFLKNLAPRTFSRLSLHFKFSGWLSAIDWSQTSAFLAEQECLRINLKDVYPQGVVEKRDYLKVRDKIIRELKSLRDPETAETVFEDVLAREEAFGVPDDDTLPDIQLITREAKYDITGRLVKKGAFSGNTFVRKESHARSANGMHRPEGVFFMKGPHASTGLKLEGLKLVDVCPTILFAMDMPVPMDMDGKVIDKAFQNDFMKTHPVEYKEYGRYRESPEEPAAVYSSDEESKLVDNLRSLGYMD